MLASRKAGVIMRNNNLFFYCGEGKMENQQIVLNKETTVQVIDGNNEFQVENVKKIEVKSAEQGKVRVSLGAQVAFLSSNKKIVINESADKICIEMLNTDEQMTKYTSLVNDQQAKGLIDYIMEYAPDLYSKENLFAQSLEELRKVKESMDDLANCY